MKMIIAAVVIGVLAWVIRPRGVKAAGRWLDRPPEVEPLSRGWRATHSQDAGKGWS